MNIGESRTYMRNGQPGTGRTQREGWVDLAHLQEVTGEWAERTFPDSTPEGVAAHFIEEAIEFARAAGLSHETILGIADKVKDKPVGVAAEEAGDCVLLLCHHAHKTGYVVLDESGKKLRRNMKRQWATKPNADGYFNHKEGT